VFKELSHQPFRRQVLLGALLLMLPLLLALIWSAWQAFGEREVDLREQTASVLAAEQAYLNQQLSDLDLLANGLSRADHFRALATSDAAPLLASVMADRPLLLNIVVTDATARVRASAKAAAPDSLRYAAACLDQIRRTGTACVGDYQVDALVRQPTVVLAYPVRAEDGSLIGVLDFALDLRSLQRVFAAIPLPPGSVVTLTDRRSRVLARSRDGEKYVGELVNPGHPLEPAAVQPINITRGLDGIEEIFGNAVIARGPWVLSVGIPMRVAADRAWPIFWRNSAISIVALGVTIVLALYMMRRVSEPVAALTATAQRIAGGDLRPPGEIATPSLEMKRLFDAFTTMADNLRTTRAELDREIERERSARQQVQLLQSQVVRQERLAAVGLLVSGIAHELANPLQAIVGATELIAREPALPPGVVEELPFIQQHSARARDIIRNLSRFARQDASPSAEIFLGDVVEAALELRARDQGREELTCEVQITSDRPVIAGFAELQQVVLTFVTNAEQAIADAGRRPGRIAIRVRNVGDVVRLEVADNGPGVPPADQPKLFQPFFTTRPVGQGTGLGLSVSYGIIDSYGGRIGYEPNEWGGATFFFELPGWPHVAGALS
jgi:signal transduction histidine kinase